LRLEQERQGRASNAGANDNSLKLAELKTGNKLLSLAFHQAV
jgi:hypothetical protein